jgi:hypothetical protein
MPDLILSEEAFSGRGRPESEDEAGEEIEADDAEAEAEAVLEAEAEAEPLPEGALEADEDVSDVTEEPALELASEQVDTD